MFNPNDTSDWTNEDWYKQEKAVNDATFDARQAVQKAFDEAGGER